MKWTSEKINELKELSSNHTVKEIAIIMNESQNNIYKVSKRFNIQFLSDKKEIWTDEKIKQLIELSKTNTAKEISSILNISCISIRRMAKKLNISIKKDTFWTEDKVERLKKLCQEHTYKDVAKIMNISYDIVIKKAQRDNILAIDNDYYWTDIEETFLKENWGMMSLESLAKRLNKSIISVRQKARRLKLGAMTNGDLSILKIDEVGDIMGVNRQTITNTWTKFGLKIRKRVITQKCYYYYIKWDELLSFLKNNQDLWDSKRVEKYMLGEEYDWLKEKRIKDNNKTQLNIKPYTPQEDIMILKLLKKKKTYDEIAKIINRTPRAIAMRVYVLGFSMSTIDELTDDNIKYIKKRSLIKK